MKKKIFLSLVMIVLFVFGILIYDFSDEMGEELVGHSWYMTNNNEVYVLSLKNNIFDLKDEEGKKAEMYRTCSTFQYNSNVSMIKLRCEGASKKIYISNADDNSLVLNDEGEEYAFYNSRELALVEDFKTENELSNEEYDELLSISFDQNLIINYNKFMSLYKGKSSVYVAFITNNINYHNVYKYVVLNNLITNSSKKFYLINVDNLNEEELKKINKITDVEEYKDVVYVFEVKKKNIKTKVKIDALGKKDLINYQNI